MVNIQPFQGLRYSLDQVQSLDVVTAPPYDVISPSEQKALHEKSPYNIVRLILGLKQPTDSDAENVYTRAHETLESWRKQGVMTREAEPAVYAYTQSWDGHERRGFIARFELEPYETGKVLPHEYTLGGPKADRLALMKATGTILSPIFCLYNDPARQIDSALFAPPSVQPLEVTDKDQVTHRFWPVTDQGVIRTIQSVLSDEAVLIADGHHRYETAVAYKAWRRGQDGQENAPAGTFPWDYTMAFFTNMADEGLQIYPTHRVVTALPEGWDETRWMTEINQVFEPTDNADPLFWLQHGAGPKQGYQLKPGVDVSAIPEKLRSLDVAYLDHFVFQGMYGKSASDLKQQDVLHFIREDAEVQDELRQGSRVFWVHAPDVEAVRDICGSGLRMPQKSTYFYPKLLSGLVLYYYGPHSQSTEQPVAAAQSRNV